MRTIIFQTNKMKLGFRLSKLMLMGLALSAVSCFISEKPQEVPGPKTAFKNGSIQVNSMVFQPASPNFKVTVAFPILITEQNSPVLTAINKRNRFVADSTACNEMQSARADSKDPEYSKHNSGYYTTSCTPVFLNTEIASWYFHSDMKPLVNGIGDNWVETYTFSLKTGMRVNWEDLFVARDSAKWSALLAKKIQADYPGENDQARDESSDVFKADTYLHYTHFTITEKALLIYIPPVDIHQGEEIWIEIPATELLPYIQKQGPLSSWLKK